jgi:hypothetical protein
VKMDSSSEDFDFAFGGEGNADRRRRGGGGGEFTYLFSTMLLVISGVLLLIWVSRNYADARRLERFP